MIAGEPQRCIDIIRRWRDALGLTVVSGTFYFGGMPQEMALRNIRRFAEEVMPAFVEGRGYRPLKTCLCQKLRPPMFPRGNKACSGGHARDV